MREKLERNFQAAARFNGVAMSTFPLRDYPGVARALFGRTAVEFWRAQDVINALQTLPLSVLEEIAPEEVAALWELAAKANRYKALHSLRHIPQPLLEQIDPERIREAWAGISGSSKTRLITCLAAKGREAIGEEEVAHTYYEWGLYDGAEALQIELQSIARGYINQKDSGLTDIWRGYAAMSPIGALTWLRRSPPSVWEYMSLPHVYAEWQQMLQVDPDYALDWRNRVPSEYRPEITEGVLTKMLLSQSANVRLRGIALLNEMGRADPDMSSPESGLEKPLEPASETQRSGR